MSRRCTVCWHARRVEIEKAVLASMPIRNIAARYGTSPSAIQRHKGGPDQPGHITKALVVARQAEIEAETLTRGKSHLETLRGIIERIEGIADVAERQADPRTALAALRELRDTAAAIREMERQAAREEEPAADDEPSWTDAELEAAVRQLVDEENARHEVKAEPAEPDREASRVLIPEVMP